MKTPPLFSRISLVSLTPLVLLLAALPSQAQVYKCTHAGKITYSEAPCAQGTETVIDEAPPAIVDKDAPAELRRMRKEADALEKQRLARQAREDREDSAQDRVAARRREKCDKLQLARKWADEDARRATPQAAESTQLKARRAAERYAAECP